MALNGRAEYERLVSERKGCSQCAGLTNPSRVCGGAFDSEHIGPYSRWHGDLEADLVIVGKEFAPVDKFIEHRGAPGRDVPTNLRLPNYLKNAGFDPGTAETSIQDSRLFFTNAILCLPPGNKMRTEKSFPEAARKLCPLVSSPVARPCGAACRRKSRRAGYACGTRCLRCLGLPSGHRSDARRLPAVPGAAPICCSASSSEPHEM